MKTRKILSLALALVMVLALTAPTTALEYGQEYAGYTAGGAQQYRDVPTNHWAYSSIETCSQRTWFNGYPDGTFRPEGYITREEAAKVFAVALGLTLEENPQITYTDTANCWAKAYIEATKALFPNVANLQGTSSFRPTQTITREETVYALLVAWRYASKTTNADLSVLNMFSDANSISAGVKPYMAVAVSEGLVSGLPDGTIAAQKGLTRAEFATLLARALNHGYGSDTTDVPAITIDKYASKTTETRLTVSGKVSPLSTGTKLTLDGDAVTLDRSGAFRVTLDLDLGENTFTFSSKNAYGVGDSKGVRITRVEPEPEPQPEPGAEPSPTPSQQPQPSQKPESTPEPVPSQKPDAPDPEPSTSPGRTLLRDGNCGTTVRWALYDDGVLEITGTGKIRDFTHFTATPWYKDYRDQIMELKISSGITYIGDYAFSKLPKLKSVSTGSDVTKLGERSFVDCENLQILTLGPKVADISSYAFAGCGKLETVYMYSSVDLVDYYAFNNCDKLQDVYYSGTEKQWENIDIRSSELPNASIHLNSTWN